MAGFSAAFFRPACYSAIPNLVREDSLVAANALVQGVENIATLIGPVLAGFSIDNLSMMALILCVGFVVDVAGRKSHAVIARGLQVHHGTP